MSTFKGIVAEFPQIRIDYFRHQPGHKAPLACFLSHVHSDHLTGLESLRAPFVYCSAATREILLRIEKYHYRMNFARGILESRNVTYDKSMRRLAKPLPLETPTIIELSPDNKIRVTLFDANHCVGAVMFLIEGNGKAILYTGDIRAEPWWVNALVQNPILLPYTLGPNRLDCIYLDTTFATKSEPYREFPSKAEGTRELLDKVAEYPEDTVFYFHSWTFGYENVWIALSAFLHSQIHLDAYRSRIYRSLSSLENRTLKESGLEIREAPALCGFRNGNHIQPGCLTSQPNVRLHSCERGMGCPVVDQDAHAKLVHIIPIVTRANGTEIAEIGAGGGKGDLDQKEELETGDVANVDKLMELCANMIKDEDLLSRVLALLQQTLDDADGKIDLGRGMQGQSQDSEDDLSLQILVDALVHHVNEADHRDERPNRTIRFPYSRHSSYSELCTLVQALKPKDVFPCTVDDDSWSPSLGMRVLFGQYCSANTFRHDLDMMEAYESRSEQEQTNKRAMETQQSNELAEDMDPISPKRARTANALESQTTGDEGDATVFVTPAESPAQGILTTSPHVVNGDGSASPSREPSPSTRLASPVTSLNEPQPPFQTSPVASPPAPAPLSTIRSRLSDSTPGPTSSTQKKKSSLTNRQIAYMAALGFGLSWADYGGLVSTKTRDDQDEPEL